MDGHPTPPVKLCLPGRPRRMTGRLGRTWRCFGSTPPTQQAAQPSLCHRSAPWCRLRARPSVVAPQSDLKANGRSYTTPKPNNSAPLTPPPTHCVAEPHDPTTTTSAVLSYATLSYRQQQHRFQSARAQPPWVEKLASHLHIHGRHRVCRVVTELRHIPLCVLNGEHWGQDAGCVAKSLHLKARGQPANVKNTGAAPLPYISPPPSPQHA